MHLTPREIDKLMILVAADLARKRRARGLRLNHPVALALVTAELLESIRDRRAVSEVMEFGTTILTRADVMEGVPEMSDEISGGCHISGWNETGYCAQSDSLKLVVDCAARALL